jgi:beta-lactamase regulating signal transducer with metallopeptidase domain
MIDESFRLLISTAIATSAAVILVALLRKTIRIVAGARIGYWSWLIVPAAVLGVLLPSAHPVVLVRASVIAGQISTMLATAVPIHVSPERRLQSIDIALAIWIAGFISLAILTARRQRRLSPLQRLLSFDPNGYYRGPVEVPMLMGAWNPRIVVPIDFETRYSNDERLLILTHERAHASRKDVIVNLIGLVVVCLYWFNPLMYWAIRWLRMDQELACDAQVLGELGDIRGRYAQTLLKTQLISDSAWRLPLGCHWHSIHPLKERIAMLKHPNPVKVRRMAGMCMIAALTGASAYAAWAAEPAIGDGPRVFVDYSIRMTNPEAPNFHVAMSTQYVVASGETINGTDGKPLMHAGEWRLGCTPYLHDSSGRSTDWSDQKARGIPIPGPGQILLECSIQHKDGNVQQVAMLAKDGSPAVVDVGEPGTALQYHLEVTPYSAMPDNFVNHLTRRSVHMDTESMQPSQH